MFKLLPQRAQFGVWDGRDGGSGLPSAGGALGDLSEAGQCFRQVEHPHRHKRTFTSIALLGTSSGNPRTRCFAFNSGAYGDNVDFTYHGPHMAGGGGAAEREDARQGPLRGGVRSLDTSASHANQQEPAAGTREAAAGTTRQRGDGQRLYATVLDGMPRAPVLGNVGAASGPHLGNIGGDRYEGRDGFADRDDVRRGGTAHIVLKDFWLCAGTAGVRCGYHNFLDRRFCRECNMERPARPRITTREWRPALADAAPGPIGRDGMRPLLGRGGADPPPRYPQLQVHRQVQAPRLAQRPPLAATGNNVTANHQRLNHARPAGAQWQQPMQHRVQGRPRVPETGGGQDDRMAHEASDEGGHDWQEGGISAAQRKKYKRRFARQQQRARPRPPGGAEQVDDDMEEEDDDEPRDGGCQVSKAEEDPRPLVQFVEPPRSRRECAVRCNLLEARVSELQEQGVEEGIVQDVQRRLEQEEKWAKDAGGRTPARLKMEIMPQGRRNYKKRESIQKAELRLEGMRKAVEDATAALRKAEDSIEVMRNQLKSGEQRYAHLTSQQAAESRPADEKRDVHEALNHLLLLGSVVPEEAKAPLEVLRKAIGRFYPAGAEAKLLLSEAGLAHGSDVEPSDADGDYVDDEDGVTEALAELIEAKTSLHELRGRREKELVGSIATGSPPVEEIIKQHRGPIKQAEQRHREARSKLEDARKRARDEIADRRKQQERQHVEAREAERDGAATWSRMRPGSVQRERARPAPTGDEELIPCLPPAKWRRGGGDEAEADGESDCTIDETPVLELAGAAIAGGVAVQALAAATSADDARSVRAPSDGQPPQHQQQALSELHLHAAAPTPMDVVVADAAVGLARETARSATRENERRRAQRRSASCQQAERDDGRSKSPRRPSAARVQETQSAEQ